MRSVEMQGAHMWLATCIAILTVFSGAALSREYIKPTSVDTQDSIGPEQVPDSVDSVEWGRLAPITTLLQPGELPPGTQTDIIKRVYRFTGPQIQPINQNFVDAINFAAVGAYTLLQFQLNVSAVPATSAPTQILSARESQQVFPLRPTNPLYQGVNYGELPSNDQAGRVVDQALNAVDVEVRIGITQNSYFPIQNFAAVINQGYFVLEVLRAYGYQGLRLIPGELALNRAAKILVARNAGKLFTVAQEAFNVSILVANVPGHRQIVPVPLVAQTSLLDSIGKGFTQLRDVNCNILQSAIAQQALINLQLTTNYPNTTLTPQDVLESFQQPAMAQLQLLGFDTSALHFSIVPSSSVWDVAPALARERLTWVPIQN